MDMQAYEASDEIDDTLSLSLSDLQIYSDPSSSSEEPEYMHSLSSFRFITDTSPRPEKVALFCDLIPVLPENDLKPHRMPQKPSRQIKIFPVQGNGSGCDDSLVHAERPRRKTGSGFLMFGLGKSPTRMELCDLRSRQARGSPARIFPVSGGGGDEKATARRRYDNCWGKWFGACIPML